mmetsp:Transcript_28969/g.74480  ORF Transcript_28969/g.74480 Transcript_28969/m.74480 type:complete len:125 (+) Transcript_28969:578-952(+)
MTSSQVKHCNNLAILFVRAKSKSSCHGLLNDAQAIKSGNLASIFCRLSLYFIKVCGYRNHRLTDVAAQVRLSCFIHLHQDKRQDLGWVISPSSSLNPGKSTFFYQLVLVGLLYFSSLSTVESTT